MLPLRARMIDDMTLAGLALGRRKSTPRRCAGWQRITGAHPISSARRRCGATCSTCASEGWHVQDKPVWPASCTATRLAVRGDWGKKDWLAGIACV
jgi:hypothetical protein